MTAAQTLAGRVTVDDLAVGLIFPSLKRIREVSAHIGTAVAEIVYARGLATVPRPDDLLAHVKSHMYEPDYHHYAAELP